MKLIKHTTFLFSAFFSFFSLCFVQVSQAQFTSTGGPIGGGETRSILAWENTAFAGINTYCYRTTDGGNRWEKLTNGLTYTLVTSNVATVNPYCFAKIGNTIYMGTNNSDRVYKTEDNGDSWSTYNTNLPTIGGYPVAIPLKAAASGNRVFLGGTNFNLAYTEESDNEWTLTSLSGTINAISPIAENTIWVNINYKTYYSHDNGDTWTQISQEPITGFGLAATDFVQVENRIIACSNGSGTNTVYYSDDYGDSWTLANTGFVIGRKLIKVGDNLIYGLAHDGLYVSTDKGVNWTVVKQLGTNSTFDMALWKNNEMLIGTAGNSLYALSDPQSGNAERVPFAFATVKSMEILNSDLYALTDLGLFTRSVNNGNWNLLSDLSSYTTSPSSFSVFDNKLYLLSGSGVFVSDDNGNSFTKNTALGTTNFKLYYITGNGTHLVSSSSLTSSGGIRYSTDNGVTWEFATLTGFPTISPLAYSPTMITEHNGTLFIAGTSPASSGYAISSDNGQSWTFVSSDATTRIYSFDDALFRLKGGNTIQKSTDNGSEWNNYVTGLTGNVYDLFLSDNKLYAVNNDIYVLNDAEESWNLVPDTDGLPEGTTISQLISKDDKLFVSIPQNSVWSTETTTTSIFSSKSNLSLSVYPNPAKNEITILTGGKSVESILELYNSIGVLEYSESINMKQSVSLPILSPGVYLIKLTDSESSYSGKLIIE